MGIEFKIYTIILTLVSFVSVSQNIKNLSQDQLNVLSTYCFCTEGASELKKIIMI